MKKILVFLLFSIFIFYSCKKDSSNPVNTETSVRIPTLIYPDDKSTGVEVPTNFNWYAINATAEYTLQVSANSSFTSFAYNQSGLGRGRQVSGLSPHTTYYWRVNAWNGSAGTSGWSTVWSFTTQ